MGRAFHVLCLVALLGGSTACPAVAGDSVHLRLESPSGEMVVRDIAPLLEIRGRAVRGVAVALDMVIAVDLSESTLYPTGFDINGDGHIGVLRRRTSRRAGSTRRPVSSWTTDAGDTVVQAELLATQRLLRRLLREDVRVGLITFAGRARQRASLGDPATALGALDRLRVRLDLTGTNLGAAIRRGVRTLGRSSRDDAADRERILVLLSDGCATVPAPEIHARRAALRAARVAAEQGVRIFAFAIGAEANAGADLFREMATITDGVFYAVQDPSEIVKRLPSLDLARLESVHIQNLTTRRRGRAVRVFEDGAFDGYVSLAPGRNDLRIRARTADGDQISVERSVHYEAPKLVTALDLARVRALANRLRVRTIETELSREARTTQRRSIEIEVE